MENNQRDRDNINGRGDRDNQNRRGDLDQNPTGGSGQMRGNLGDEGNNLGNAGGADMGTQGQQKARQKGNVAQRNDDDQFPGQGGESGGRGRDRQ